MNNKRKIAIIGVKGLPSFGGGARATESMLLELKDDFDITVYSVSSHTKLSGNYHGINQITFNAFPIKRLDTLFYYLKSMFHCLFMENYDVVHVQHIYAGFIIPFLRLKYPVINTVRGIIPKKDNKWNKIDKFFFRLFEYIALRTANITVSVCQPHIEYLNTVYKKEIIYIPNGVYTYPEILNNKVDEGYLCFSASRIISLKGCHIFLEALHKINYTGKIKIIGSLDHVPNYKNEILKLSKGLDIDFLGLIVDKFELYKIVANARLFIFPSLNEGMSNMLLEAASLKTPIIASDIIENMYIFNHDEVAFFKTNNSEDLADKIELNLSNMDNSEKLADNAFFKVKEEHDWPTIASKYKVLYQLNELKATPNPNN